MIQVYINKGMRHFINKTNHLTKIMNTTATFFRL